MTIRQRALSKSKTDNTLDMQSQHLNITFIVQKSTEELIRQLYSLHTF